MLVKPYTTLLEVQTENKNSGTELDDWYKKCITMASRLVDEKCRRDFWYHDHRVDYLSLDEQRVIEDEAFIPYPIISVTEFSLAKHYDDSFDTVDLGDIIARQGTYIIKSKAGVFGSYPFDGEVRLKGEFGYVLDSADPDNLPPVNIPSEVRRATTLIACALSAENHKEQVGLDGTRVELLSTYIPTEAMRLLQRWIVRFTTNF